MGGEARFLPQPKNLKGDDYQKWQDENDSQQAAARDEGQSLLMEMPWAVDILDSYFDVKDHGRQGPELQTSYMKDAFRAIRQGSCGLLGNAPLL